MKMNLVHIKHFKSLKDIHLMCENLIALIGENNSGKSNLMEALDLFFNPLYQKLQKRVFMKRIHLSPSKLP